LKSEDAMRPTFELVLAGGAPHQFVAFVPDASGGRAAEHAFEWRDDSVALALELGALAQAAIAGRVPDDDLHLAFGRRLFDAVFGGAVGELWRARLAEARRQPLRLVVRIDATSARPLLNLPWEYLHDGRDFLALSWRTPLSRLAWGLPVEALGPLAEPLRLLVLIAAPLGLGQNEVLNTAREEDLILSVLAQARRAGQIEIEFAPSGSLEALEAALREFDPHVLHFVGHGVFDEARDRGLLLMETPDGRRREVPNAEFAGAVARQARSLRLVFLSACQSAVAPRAEGYADLGRLLLDAGIPAVVAMQFRVLNRSAMAFGGAFYKGVADGDPLDGALAEARNRLKRESPNTVDFATPVLLLADPDCLRVDQSALRPARSQAPLDLTGVTSAQNFVGRTAELRELRTALDPDGGRWRAAIIHGLGGMGKTVLAARLAERMAARFDGIKSIRVTPTTSAKDILDQVSGFLLVNNARLNSPLIVDFARTKDEPLPLESKAAALIEIMGALRLLLIFDNYEDVLPEGRPVSRAAVTTIDDRPSTMPPSSIVDRPSSAASAASAEPATDVGVALQAGADPDLAKLIALLIAGLKSSRLLFTSRVDFSLIERGRLAGAIGHIALDEMQFRDAVYLMETLPPLDSLPVVALPETRPDRDADSPLSPADPDSLRPRTGAGPGMRAGRALSMRDLYERLGGHPYTLALFAEHALRSSAQAVLDDLAGVQRELLDFTLLDRAAAALPERAQILLRRAAIYDEPAPLAGLAFLVGDERDCMPDVHDEAEALLRWGVIARPPGSADYAVHALVRDWARATMTADERLALLRRAAQFWRATGRESSSLVPELNARHYLFLAGDYEQADDIVNAVTELLLRWGQIELLLRLLNESVRTLNGPSRAVALGNRATVYQALGDYATARRDYEQVLAEFQALGNRRNVATALHQLGMLHQQQGEYEAARQRYQESLVIAQALGDRAGVSQTLHQLGNLHYLQGEYDAARQRYQESLAIKQALGDRAGVATSLHQLGMLHYLQGEYEAARQRYQESLAIKQALGDRAGVARTLHQLGMLHYLQGEYEAARQRYQESLATFQELGNRAGVATSLHQLGMLHQDQGEYDAARQRYQESLAIAQELGNRAGVANTLGQLGILEEQEGQMSQAVAALAQAFALFEQLGAPEREQARRDLARLRQKIGDAAFAAALDAANVPGLTPDMSEQEDSEQGMTIERATQVAVNNTIAVLTQAPERKAEWLDALEQLQAQTTAQELGDFAAFLGLLRQVVEGTAVDSLAAGVPPSFAAAWAALSTALSSPADEGRTTNDE
jgi:tetratricopeptide (TPR) repeat protein